MLLKNKAGIQHQLQKSKGEFDQQMEERRLKDRLNRVQKGKIVLTFPTRLTPFCFPIKVDSMRENLTSEKLADRVKRMQEQLNRPQSAGSGT